MTSPRFAPPPTRLDDAARAGWLYYVAGNTQDEIAAKLGVSRQTAQRLVAMAVSERLGGLGDGVTGAVLRLGKTARFGLAFALAGAIALTVAAVTALIGALPGGG